MRSYKVLIKQQGSLEQFLIEKSKHGVKMFLLIKWLIEALGVGQYQTYAGNLADVSRTRAERRTCPLSHSLRLNLVEQ